jgi:cytochrome b subunit of formate dehydrogenase
MPTRKLAARLASVAMIAAAALFGGAAAAADSGKQSTPGTDLSNKSCLSCHDGKRGKLEVEGADGEKRKLRPVAPEKFASGMHSHLECISCHREINDSVTPHRKTVGEKKPDCVQCHEELAKTRRHYTTAGARRSMRVLAENVVAYGTSSHAKRNRDDPTRVNASCNDCHNVHSFNVPAPGSPARAEWRLGLSDLCGTCHDVQLEEWAESVHGREIKEKKNAKSATCVDCHTAHQVRRPRADAVKLAITASCGDCHQDAYRSYRSTYHGQVVALGFAYTAKCFDCHGSHTVEPSKDSKAKMHVANRLEACQECHSGKKNIPLATAGFVSFSPHGVTDDFERYPQLWIANKIMVGLLTSVFAFFWLHSLLWFYREYKERRLRRVQPHVKFDDPSAVPAELKGKQFQRFSRTWRVAHLMFLLSVMTLTLSGIPLFFPQAPWANTLIHLLGGPQTAGTIHRVAAVVLTTVFFWHIFYAGVRIFRDRKRFRIFGPTSLIPGPQDVKDMIAMFKWFLGKGPRPKFDRWTYWEKFDYWAPFWGVAIIGGSGLMLWMEHVTARYLPGWVFNVATVFHSEEAFLAVVFLFTVHFFNCHFRPDKFPLDRVMFTGTFTLEEMQHEHPLEYERLVASGELEKHLVDAPSPAMWKGTGVLGFTLITIGLTLLTLVWIGFFTSP